MAGGQINFKVGYTVDKAGLQAMKASLQEIQSMTANDLIGKGLATNIADADAKLKLAQQDAQALSNILTQSFNKDLGTVNIQKFNNALKTSNLDLNKVYANMSAIGTTGVSAFRNMATQVLTTNLQLKKTHNLLDSMAETMGNTVKWGIASSIMNSFTGKVQEAYGYVKNLDSSLNNIRIVTEKSADEMEKFADKANKAAKALASSTKEYSDASLIYYQQGLSDEEAAARTETTIKTANVTGQSAEEVSEQLTAVWNGYKVNSQEAELYVDKLAAVAATTASDLEELSTGMSKVASAANSMGVNVDQLNAQLATIVSVTRQAPESVGTALKTIFARMGDLAVEGTDEFGTSLGEVSGKMEQMGIKILDEQGNLRDMGIVIEETAAKWDTWTESQKQAAAVAMAGKRQYNNLIALFENWDMYTEALNTSQNSLGTLQNQQDIYMESTEAHLQRMSTAWEDVYDSMLDEGTINTFADVWGGVGNLFANIIDGLGGGGETLLMLGSILLSVFSKQLASGVATFSNNIENARFNLQQFNELMRTTETLSSLEDFDTGIKRVNTMEKALLSLRGVMNSEQFNEGQAFIQQTRAIEEEIEALNKAEEEAKAFYTQMTGVDVNIVDKDGKRTITDVAGNDITRDVQKDFSNFSQDFLVGRTENLQEQLNLFEQLTQARNEYVNATKTFNELDVDTTDAEQYQAAEMRKLEAKEALQQASQEMASAMEQEKQRTDALADSNRILPKEMQKVINAQEMLEEAFKGDGKTLAENIFSAQDISEIELYLDSAKEVNDELTKMHQKAKEAFSDNTAGQMKDKVDQLKDSMQGFNTYLEQFRKVFNIQNIIQTVSAFGQLASAITSIKNLGNIWSNEDISTGDKLLQTVTNLGFALPMLVSSFKAVAAALKLDALWTAISTAAKTAYAAATAVGSGALVAFGAAIKAVTVAMYEFWISLGPIGWAVAAIGLLVGAIAALSAIFGDFETAQEKANRQFKDASQALQDSAKAAQEATSAYEELKSTIESYEDARKAIDDLAKGTDEWKDAVVKLNQQVLNLMQTYPELSKYIKSEDGVLTISQEGTEYLLNKQLKDAQTAQTAQMAAQNAYEKASQNQLRENIKANMVNKAAEVGAEYYTWEYDPHNTDSYVGELLNSDIIYTQNQKLLTDVEKHGEISNKTIASVLDDYLGTTQYVRDKDDMETSYTVNQKDIDDLAALLNKEELDSTRVAELADIFDFETRLTDADGLTTGWEVNEEWISWAQAMISTTEAEGTKIYKELQESTRQLNRIANFQNKIATDENFTALSTEEQNIISSIGANSDLYKNEFDTAWAKVNEELEAQKGDEKAIAELLTEAGMAIKSDQIEDQGDKFVITKDDGTTETWTNQQLKEFYAMYRAENLVTGAGKEEGGKSGYEELLDEYNKKVKYDSISGEQDKTLFESGALSGGEVDLSKMTMDEIEALYTEVSTMGDSWGEGLTNEAAKLFKFKTADALRTAVQDAIEPDKMAEMWNTKAEEFASKVEKTGSLLETAYSGEEWSDEQKQSLEALGQEYEILNKIKDKGSRAYIEALEEIQELEEENLITAKTKALKFAADAIKDEDSETEGIQVNLNQDDLTEVGDQIQALFDTTYELDIAITDEIISDVENIINRAEGLQTAVASIGEGFKVAAEDSEELFKVFPELAEGAEILANGTIQLDKQVVDSVLGGQAEIIDGDKNVVRQKIQNRIKELDIEIDTIDAQLEAVKDGTLEKSELTDILTELQNQNSENVTNTEGENIKTQVSNDAQGTTAIIDNWSAKEDAAIAYAKTARKAIRSVFTGEKVDKAITSDSYGKVVSTVETKEGTTVEDTDKMTSEELAELVETNLVNRKQSLINQRAELVKWGASMYDETTTKIQEADEGNDKELDFLEDEKDIYHDINIEIQQLENSMEELQEQQEKLYGQDLLVNLQQQLNLLEKQEDAQRRKLAIAQQEAATLKSTLAGQGTTFNADGTIANYQTLYDQKLAYVNSVIASGDEDAADAAQKAFEEWISNVERYDELLTGELPEIDQMLRDIANQRIEKQIEAFEYEIQLKLDVKDAERDWNDFKRNMTIDEDDILGNTRFSLDSFKSYLGDDGTITTLLDKNRELMDQYNQIQTTGTSSIYGDNMAALMEDMQENQEELMSAMEEQKDLLDEIEEAYVNMLDAAQEAFDEQVAQYEAINEVYSHGLNVINVLYGEDAYADMEGFYQKQMENNNQIIDMQRQNVEFYKRQLEDTTLTDEQREEVQRKLQEAQAALHSSVESQIDLIVEKYTNAINKIFKELEDKMTNGKGLSYIQEEWDLLNQNAEMYLDQINSAYEVEKLAREYNKAIDATDSLSAQRKLNELMEQQLQGLREKEKLTQYDVDRANALLDVELKRIALEEAQQNKSKMRLRRDASGNYSYQFVSDEEATAEAQQELADAQNSLYNLDKDALQENQESALNMWTEFKDKYIEIMSDVTLTDEEREARLQQIREQYGEMYNNLLMQNEEIRKNLEASALDEMKELNLDYILGENGLVPTWDSGVQQMMEKFAGEGGLLPTCSEAFGELSNLTAQYDADLALLEVNAGYSLGNIAGYTEEVVTQMESVLTDNDELIAKYEEELRQLGELRSEVSSLMSGYDALTAAATQAANAILNTRKVEADVEAEKAAQEAAAQQQAADEAAAAAQTQAAAQQPSLTSGSSVTVKTTATHFSRDGGSGTRMKSFVPGSTYSVMQVSGNEILIGRGGVATGWVNKTDLVGFNTGGYTGDWADNSGRLAFIHKKELILNSQDTKNILQAVDIVRSIDGIMESIMGKAFDRVNAQLNGLNSMNIPVSSTATDSTIEQHIEINADFPGVEKASEIISAFENLTNMATQYAFKTDR